MLSWWHKPVTQRLGSEGKEDRVFKVTSAYTKSEANFVYKRNQKPKADFELSPRCQPLKQLEL